MVTPAAHRQDKYKSKIVGDVIGARYDATKDRAVRKQKHYFASAEKLEEAVKRIIDGTSSMLQHFYIAYAEELSSTPLNSEKEIAYCKWLMRGLDEDLLKEIGRKLSFGLRQDIVCPEIPEPPECPGELPNFSDDFSVDTSGNYTSDYFCYFGGGFAVITLSVVAGKLHIVDTTTNCYNHVLTRRKTDYVIPWCQDFDFSVSTNRRTSDSYIMGIELWNDAISTKYLSVRFSDFSNASYVSTHIEQKYAGVPNNPGDPFIVRVRRIGTIYTCWVDGTQIFNGAIPELSGEDLRYGVATWRTSGPTGNAINDYDDWTFTAL